MSSTSRRALVSSSAVVCVVAAFGLSCSPSKGGGSEGASAPKSDEHALIGAMAPDLDLPRIGGTGEKPRFVLSEHRGKVVVIDFWATWCAPCRDSFPAYQAMTAERAADVVFVGVSVDEEPDGIPSFVEETGVMFPVVWDEGQAAAGAYSPPTMPTSYVVDRNGIVRFVHAGYRPGDESELAAVVDSLR